MYTLSIYILQSESQVLAQIYPNTLCCGAKSSLAVHDMTYRFYSLLLCILCLVLLLTSCNSSSQPASTKSIARIACGDSAHTLDHRAARSLIDASFLNCFFEGLMRVDVQGHLVPGVAKEVKISDDGLTYTFTLRDEARWSDGEPVTSYDFATSWKAVLDPQFAAPNAFQLYPIKNAHSLKSGAVSLDNLGVYTPDAQTLVVTLEKPSPHFLELTTFFTLFPVNQRNLNSYNGPFQLAAHTRQDEVVATRNLHYWDRDSVKLDEVHFVFVDEHTALGLFQTGGLDLTGSPLSVLPSDAIGALESQVHAVPAAATQWLRFQVENGPTSNLALRKALTLAINRRALIDHVVRGNQLPATGLIPPGALWNAQSYFADHDLEGARQALQEVGHIGTLRLTYIQSERNHRIAQMLQEQWRAGLGIHVELEALESQIAFQKIKSRDYQIAIGSWFADIRDPMNFLAVFERKDNGTNNTQWENPRYQELIALSDLAKTAEERTALLQQAEAILIQDFPIAPIYYYRLNYLLNPKLKGVAVSELGIISLRDAYFEG